MLRSLILALCAVLFVACATAPPPPPADVPVISETPRWVSGELDINFTTDPPQVKLCIGGSCNMKLKLMGRIKDGTAALMYPVPHDHRLRYDDVDLLPREQPDGTTRWTVYAVSRNFGDDDCTRWFLAVVQGPTGEPGWGHYVVMRAPERQLCRSQIRMLNPEPEDFWTPDEYKPKEP